MALSTTQDLVLAVILFLVFAIAIVGWKVMLPAMIRRKRANGVEGTAWIEDKAFNQIQAGRALADFCQREGIDAPGPTGVLEQAQLKFDQGRYKEAADLAKTATNRLAEVRRSRRAAAGTPETAPLTLKSPSGTAPKDPPVYRDLARRVGDPEPEEAPPAAAGAEDATSSTGGPSSGARPSVDLTTMPKEERADGDAPAEGEEASLASSAKKLPKNYLEARFMLNALQNDLQEAEEAKAGSPQVKEAQDWAKQGQALFDRKDYDGALRLALRGRRRLGGGGLSTIALSPATVVQTPPPEPSDTAQRSSGPLTPSASPPAEATVCPKCGRAGNPASDRFCRSCGAPLAPAKCPRCQRQVEADDKFCHGCGSPLGGPP